MKTAIQLVDDFVENLIEGNIESYLEAFTQRGTIETSQAEEHLKEFRKAIQVYRLEPVEAAKPQKAEALVNQILHFRLNGLLKNNPNTVKGVIAERDFYKSRATVSEERGKDLEDKLKAAYESNQNLQLMLEDARKGRQGMHQG